MKCWICGAEANSGEHIPKASDISSVFGEVVQNKPIYKHDNENKNLIVKGIKSSILKSNARICMQCNNQRTQPHDRAWEKFSYYLRNREPKLESGQRVRLSKVFPGSRVSSILGVHLFFVKLFGCQIAEHEIPISLELFSKAILENVTHPHIHLAICPAIYNYKMIGGSEVYVDNEVKHITFATWFYYLDSFCVRVMYAEPGENREGMIGSWHPSKDIKLIRIAKLDERE